MTTQSMRCLAIASTAALLIAAASPARAGSAGLVTSLTGRLHIEQEIPCGAIDTFTAVSGGQIRLAPAQGIDVAGGKFFSLTRANVSFAAFTVTGSCLGLSQSRTYEAIGIQLAKAVSFTAVALGGNVYAVTIPKSDFLLYETSIVDGEPELGYKHPSEDVTGSINLATRTVTMHVVLATRVHFEAGCTLGRCVIDETGDGTQTADISGVLTLPDVDGDGVPNVDDNCKFTANPDQTPVPTPVVTPPPPVTLTSCGDHAIGAARGVDVCDRTPVSISNNAPSAFHAGLNVVTWTGVDGKGRTGTATQNVTVIDTTRPTVSCTAIGPPQGNSFIVRAGDICGEPVIRLGSYVLNDGERIKIEEIGKAGVTFIDLVGGGFRHFHVGKGQAIVTATDSSGNTATAVCR